MCQEFKRNFSFLSALGFVSVYMATWEFVLVSLSVGFSNGGYAGLFWCFLTTVTCYATVVASLAEMESMAPTAGGQYHWVSEFAPPQYQRSMPEQDLCLTSLTPSQSYPMLRVGCQPSDGWPASQVQLLL